MTGPQVKAPTSQPRQPSATSETSKPTFRCVSKLGSGAYATVWLAVDAQTQQNVAVKVVNDPKYFSYAVYESNISKDLDHPNLVKTLSCFKTQNQSVMMVQEYAAQGDLFNKIVPEVGMDHEYARVVMSSVIDGLEYLHSKGLVHRDVKPENVVVTEDNVPKLCDFGMMEYEGRKATHGSGTTPYMAPEILATKHNLIAHFTDDIWALGVFLFVLLTGDFPWLKAVPTDPDYAAFLAGNFNREPWNKLSPQLIKLFQRIFVPVEARCSLQDIKKSLDINFFASASIDSLATDLFLNDSISLEEELLNEFPQLKSMAPVAMTRQDPTPVSSTPAPVQSSSPSPRRPPSPETMALWPQSTV